ncbi:Hypothetical predicted protein [Marmota monax]|uniref:Uncharacterized protein n=1 Tax=Marmota monax TaxID=9995 RepID=A0A5E4AFZ4_MARMO|nr:hypothetical protein GHT09_008091 [Marmota monax]VTJ55696.1 Hypothetical predicted protein [Marmota monax]
MLVWWQGGWGGGLPWTWPCCAVAPPQALVPDQISLIAAANPTLHRPPPLQGASKSLDFLSIQTNHFPALEILPAQVPSQQEGQWEVSRGSPTRTQSLSNPTHPLESQGRAGSVA